MTKPIHPIALRVEGYKRITVAEATFDEAGGVVAISGENEAGKSSFLDAFEALIAGRSVQKPKQPINKDSAAAKIIGTFKEEDGAEIVVTRTYAGEKSESKVVVTMDGLRVADSSDLLKRFYSHIAIDPMAFAALDPKKQADVLVGLTGFDPATLDAEYRNVYATRTTVGQEVTRLKGTVESYGPVVDVGSAVDVASVAANLTAANEQLVLVSDKERAVEKEAENILELERDIASLEARLAETKSLQAAVITQHATLEAELATMERPDPQQFRDQLASAEEQNDRVRVAEARARAAAELEAAETKKAALTARLTAIDKERADGFAAADMPVDGLSIVDGEVYLDGTPFSQTSPGGVLRTSMAIAMALSPDLKAIVVRNGSLLDRKNRALVAEMATEKGYLVLMELVDDSGEVGVVFTDGTAVQRQ